MPVLGNLGRGDRDRGRPAGAGEGVSGRRRPRHAGRPRARRPARRGREGVRRGGVGVRRRDRVRRDRTSSTAATSRCRSSATADGTCSSSGERDCSIQRRHQKVVEETPAPRPARRDPRRRCTTPPAPPPRRSTTAAPAPSSSSTTPTADRFFFLEMNTRLQVEHPVTECVHGVDLVELQLAVAEGASVSRRCAATVANDPTGHAIEVRLYAEDPAADWQPQSGRLTRFEIPDASDGIRVDSGFETGNEVSTHYDAMLAKVIALGADARPGGAPARRRAVPGADPRPGHQPRPAGADPAATEAFLAGEVSTAFLDGSDVSTGPTDVDHRASRSVAAAIALAEQAGDERTVQRGIPVGWRNVVSQPQRTEFDVGDVEVEWLGDARRLSSVDGLHRGRCSDAGPGHPRARRRAHDVRRRRRPATRSTSTRAHGHVALTRVPRFVDPAEAGRQRHRCSRRCPAPCVRVAVEQGRHGDRGPGRAGARGDEDAAHHQRAARRRGDRDRRDGRRAGGRRRRTRSRRRSEE